MKVLESYVQGKWVEGTGGTELFNPTTEEVVAKTSTDGIDMQAALAYARDTGGPALRELGFAKRAELLGNMSKAIHAHRDELLDLAAHNGGNTRGDAKFDVDGCTGTLSYYSKLGAELGDGNLLGDDEPEQLSRSPRWVGRHLRAPLRGVALHINAFNFPAWGFGEKAATALLAGMPVVCKPATSTAVVTARIAEILVEKNVLPAGALSFLFGSARDVLDHLDWQDVVAFTGSADTGLKIRGHDGVLGRSVRVNVEADSLNAAVLGPDLDGDADAYEEFLREVTREITQKAGQKCTATRRIFVPEGIKARVIDDLKDQLGAVKVGDPTLREVKMGPLATAQQLRDVTAELGKLREVAEVVLGDGGRGELVGIDNDKGYFLGATLLSAGDADKAAPVHSREVFGPVATVMAYNGKAADAARLLGLGGGSLVSSVYTDDDAFALEMVEGAVPFLGRLHLGSAKVAEHAMSPGTVLPMLVHGGPGRAGGGEELGGRRGLSFYMQRTAVQGYAPLLEKLA